jgi:hypothetical protein
MRITDEHVGRYRDEGVLFLPDFFSPEETGRMRAELPGIYSREAPGRVLEKGTGIVRSVYGSHADNEVFGRLVRHPEFVDAVERILGSGVYVHQFKINAKQAMGGEVWEWHQDYIFWRNEDGMPAARVVNVVVFLDEVTEFNGPLLFIPRTHHLGVIDTGARQDAEDPDAPAWASNVAAALTYSIGREILEPLVQEHGIVAPKGAAGSVLLFHPDIVHGSAPNMSPRDRSLALITYNSVENVPVPGPSPRPEFLCARDHTPLTPLVEEPLPA